MIRHSACFDLNHEFDQNHLQHEPPFTTPNHHIDQPVVPSSFSSLSYDHHHPFLFNPPQHQHGSYYLEQPNHLPTHIQKGEKSTVIPCSGSWDQEDHSEPEKKEIIKRRLAVKLQVVRKKKEDEQQQPLLSHDSSSSINNYCSNQSVVVRVCSDCHTTKTPLWRSGPRGPKSLCNACGIRQRKARRAAMAAAAASGNGTILVAGAGETSMKQGNKKLGTDKKEKKSKIVKKKRKQQCEGRKDKLLGYEDLRLSLSKNIQVFPQDEKEAAILLMALSYG